MNDQQRAAFEAWQANQNPKVYPAERQAFEAGWQAALQSPEVEALRKDSQRLSAIESDEGADIIRLSSDEWEVSGYAKDLYGTGRTLREAIDNAIKEAEMTRQCPSCGGFCGSKKCERENIMSKNHQEIDTSSERVDEIKLPPLPYPIAYAIAASNTGLWVKAILAVDAEYAGVDLMDQKYVGRLITTEQAEVYARAAIEAVKPHIIAEFLDRTGQWVTNKATHDKAISDAIEADRQARGEPVAWFVDWPDEPELGHYFSEGPVDGARSLALVFQNVGLPPQQQASEPVFTLKVSGPLKEWTPTHAAFDIPDGEHKLYLSPQPQQIPEGYKAVPVEPEACEPVKGVIERLAINRYRPVPAGVFSYKVVAGNGSRSLFSGTKDECKIVAAKLTEAFLDGAHVAQQPAEPVNVPSNAEVLKIAIDSGLASRDGMGDVVCAWREDADISKYLVENARALLAKYSKLPAPQPQQISDEWKQAIDYELVTFGTTADSYSSPKEAINVLIDCNVSLATDPKVNGGYMLLPIEPTDKMLGAALRHIDGMASMPSAYKAMLEAAPEVKGKS